MDRDKLNAISMREAATATMGIIDRAQDYEPHRQVFAIAAAFRLLAERQGIEPQDVMNVVGNVLAKSEDGTRIEFDAVRDYLENEV